MATSGFGPASARAAAKFIGLLSMRSTPTSVPAWSSRTTNDRARCRSTAAYCRFTGPLLVRSRLGLLTSSVPLERLRAGEDRPFVSVAGIASLQQLAAAPSDRSVSESEAIALSCHHFPAYVRRAYPLGSMGTAFGWAMSI